jgi:hypothetical protein
VRLQLQHWDYWFTNAQFSFKYLPPVTLKEKYALTVSNNKKISNDKSLESSQHIKKRMIQVNNLSKKYNGTTVLNIENLEIPKRTKFGSSGK